MSYYNYNLEKNELNNSFNKAKNNINETNQFDDSYESIVSINIETQNILKKERVVFILTGAATTLLTIFTLQTILK